MESHHLLLPAGDGGEASADAQEIFSERTSEFNFLELLFPSLERARAGAKLTRWWAGPGDALCSLPCASARGRHSGRAPRGCRLGRYFIECGCKSSFLQSKSFPRCTEAGRAPARDQALLWFSRSSTTSPPVTPTMSQLAQSSSSGVLPLSSLFSPLLKTQVSGFLSGRSCQPWTQPQTRRKDTPPCSSLL